jgi:hypothetical protein
VVLKSNEGKSETGVLAEPELEGDVEGGSFGGIETSAGKLDGVANHVVITNLETGLEREFIPYVQPFTIVSITLVRVSNYSNRLYLEQNVFKNYY